MVASFALLVHGCPVGSALASSSTAHRHGDRPALVGDQPDNPCSPLGSEQLHIPLVVGHPRREHPRLDGDEIVLGGVPLRRRSGGPVRERPALPIWAS